MQSSSKYVGENSQSEGTHLKNTLQYIRISLNKQIDTEPVQAIRFLIWDGVPLSGS